MSDFIDKKEFLSLLRESVRANTTNAESTKAAVAILENLRQNMCDINDKFVLHNLEQENIDKDIKTIKKDLLRWIKICVLVIFTLLGGILITKALGLDIVELIKN